MGAGTAAALGLVALVAALPSAALARGQAKILTTSGGLIAFVRDPACNTCALGAGGSVFTAHPDGSSLEQLTVANPAHEGENQWPTWSPDGEQLAFFCGEPDTCHTTILGSTQQTVPVTTTSKVFQGAVVPPSIDNVVWCGNAPALKQIYEALSPRGNAYATNDDGVLTVQPLGGVPRAGQEPDFTWCGRNFYDANGSTVNAKIPTPVEGFAWSPDGSRIAAMANDGLYVVTGDGSGAHLIYPTPFHLYPGKSGYFAPKVAPAWSPDGKQIAFVEPADPSYSADSGSGADNETDIWTIDADGSKPKRIIRNATEPSWQSTKVPFEQCSIDKPELKNIPLSSEENAQLAQQFTDFEAGYAADVRKAIAALRRDAAAHPANRAADTRKIAVLQRSIGGSRSLESAAGGAAATEAERQLVRDAACGLIKEAVDSLNGSIDGARIEHKAQAKELVTRVGQFGEVITGKDKPDSAAARLVLIQNIAALIKQFGGPDASKYVTGTDALIGKGAKLYDVLRGHLDDAQLSAQLRSQVADLAKRLGGDEVGVFTQQVIALRDVLSGNATEDEQFTALKTAFVDLATRLVDKGLMSRPQVRAAMLGFQIGTALGNNIAENLKIIQKVAFTRACDTALYLAQKKAGENVTSYADVDYTKRTKTTVTKEISPLFEDTDCEIDPQGFREGVKGGVVKAILPVYLFGWFGPKIDYTKFVYYDPTFAR